MKVYKIVIIKSNKIESLGVSKFFYWPMPILRIRDNNRRSKIDCIKTLDKSFHISYHFC